MLKVRLTLVLIILIAVLPIRAQTAPANLTDSCVETFDPEQDYFPDKVEVSNAQGFSVEYFRHYKLVTVLPFVGATNPLTYLLVQCGAPLPADIEADATITVPVDNIVTLSTTILPHLVTQNLVDRLIAVDTFLYTSTQEVLARADQIAEIGGGGSMGAINLELLLELQPALIMGQQFFDGDTAFQPVQDAGLSVVLNSDFADTSPLGQAEWGKYIALYFNTEALANAAYDAVVSRYSDLQSLTAALPDAERPTVIAASPYAGTWYMPAGESTVAQLIADAGGNFLFADLAGTSVPLDFETVLDRGADADFWVNVNQFWASTADMLADDPRYETFSAFQNDRLWNNNLRQNANGGNDYFESGAANPDLLLADLIAIFHPDLLPDHEFTYYQPLTAAD